MAVIPDGTYVGSSLGLPAVTVDLITATAPPGSVAIGLGRPFATGVGGAEPETVAEGWEGGVAGDEAPPRQAASSRVAARVASRRGTSRSVIAASPRAISSHCRPRPRCRPGR